jgi:hypothetical protein
MLEGDGQRSEAFGIAAVETHRRLGKGMPLTTFAGFERFYAVLMQGPNSLSDAFVDVLVWRLATRF